MVKNPPANGADRREVGGFDPWVGKMPWRRAWQLTPVFLFGQRSLVGYSPWGRKESDITGQLSIAHFLKQLFVLE